MIAIVRSAAPVLAVLLVASASFDAAAQAPPASSAPTPPLAPAPSAPAAPAPAPSPGAPGAPTAPAPGASGAPAPASPPASTPPGYGQPGVYGPPGAPPPAAPPAYGQPGYGQPAYGTPGQPGYGPGYGAHGGAYGPTPGAPGAWGPPPPDAEAEKKPASKGATADGIPLTHRGGVVLESSVFKSGDERLAGGSLALEGRLHVGKHVFLDARIPFGLANAIVVGNPSLEVRGIVPLGRGKHFVVVGGGLGLPILDTDSQFDESAQAAALASAFWDIHEFSPWTVPIIMRFGTEHHLGGIAILRTEVDPVIHVPYGDNDEPEVTIQPAFEAQLGQKIGGGVRLQAVVMPTWEDTDNDLDLDGDLAQLAFEPFFSMEGEQLGARLGLMLPVDEIAGPPFATSWALHLTLGMRLE